MPKGPKHFKVHCSIATHRKTAAMFTDNDLFATWTRLGILAVERFADRTGNSFRVSDRELMAITGKGRVDVARTLVSRLAHVSPTSASRDGDVWLISFPNFSKKQGFKSGNGVQTGSSASASPTATSTKKKERQNSAPSAPKRARKQSRMSEVPDQLSEADRQSVIEWAAAQSPPITLDQLTYGWKVFRAKARGNGYRYARHAQAFRNALGEAGEAWALKGYGGNSPPSSAEAREDRVKEAARKAVDRLHADRDRFALIAGGQAS